MIVHGLVSKGSQILKYQDKIYQHGNGCPEEMKWVCKGEFLDENIWQI
jgi:hypothetical protein